MDEKMFVTLAEGYVKQHKYRSDLWHAILNTAEKHKVCADFLGMPYETDLLGNAVLNAIKQFDLQETFEYWLFECDCSFEKFNERIEWTGEDGKLYRPSVYNLSELYHYILAENTPKTPLETCEFTKLK